MLYILFTSTIITTTLYFYYKHNIQDKVVKIINNKLSSYIERRISNVLIIQKENISKDTSIKCNETSEQIITEIDSKISNLCENLSKNTSIKCNETSEQIISEIDFKILNLSENMNEVLKNIYNDIININNNLPNNHPYKTILSAYSLKSTKVDLQMYTLKINNISENMIRDFEKIFNIKFYKGQITSHSASEFNNGSTFLNLHNMVVKNGCLIPFSKYIHFISVEKDLDKLLKEYNVNNPHVMFEWYKKYKNYDIKNFISIVKMKTLSNRPAYILLPDKEIDNKEIDNKEIDNKEIDNKEIDNKEIDNKEIDNKNINEIDTYKIYDTKSFIIM
jgi:hypothetical protein